jgi:hypothetical protein
VPANIWASAESLCRSFRRHRERIMGPMTPTKILSLGLFVAGLAVLLSMRWATEIDGGLLTGIALALIGLSFLTDALLPGGSELTVEQEVMLKQIGLNTSTRGLRAFSVVIGAPLTLLGVYLAATNS